MAKETELRVCSAPSFFVVVVEAFQQLASVDIPIVEQLIRILHREHDFRFLHIPNVVPDSSRCSQYWQVTKNAHSQLVQL